MTYPLPCSSLTADTCHMIQAPALAALLPKLHLNRHSPRAIVYAGPKHGGLQITDLYIDQGYGQLTLFIGHLKLADEIGALILSVLSHLASSMNPSWTRRSVFPYLLPRRDK